MISDPIGTPILPQVAQSQAPTSAPQQTLSYPGDDAGAPPPLSQRVLPPWQQRSALPPAGMAPRPQMQPQQQFSYAPQQQSFGGFGGGYGGGYGGQSQFGQGQGYSPAPWQQQMPQWGQQMVPSWMQNQGYGPPPNQGYSPQGQGYGPPPWNGGQSAYGPPQRPMMNPWQQSYQSPWPQKPPFNGGQASNGNTGIVPPLNGGAAAPAPVDTNVNRAAVTPPPAPAPYAPSKQGPPIIYKGNETA